LAVFGLLVIRDSRLSSTVGMVHWMVDNQRVYKPEGFEGRIGRAVANKWVVALEQNVRRATETIDPNILFFVGHPAERAGVAEQRYLPWWLLPFWLIGVLTIRRTEVGLLLAASAWAMAVGTVGAGMYPMTAVYGWVIFRGMKYLWRRR